MWKKEDMPEPVTYSRPDPVTPEPVRPVIPTTGPVIERSAGSERASGERATIGRSITIRGDVTGDEDLLIQGRIDGSVDLKQHSVTIGREGDVKADVAARVIVVEGRVQGNLAADEQVVLKSSAQVQGDIVAPRVVLEDGARFRGGVDMGEPLQAAAPAARPNNAKKEPSAKPAAEATASAEKDKSTTPVRTDGGAKPAEVTA